MRLVHDDILGDAETLGLEIIGKGGRLSTDFSSVNNLEATEVAIWCEPPRLLPNEVGGKKGWWNPEWLGLGGGGPAVAAAVEFLNCSAAAAAIAAAAKWGLADQDDNAGSKTGVCGAPGGAPNPWGLK